MGVRSIAALVVLLVSEFVGTASAAAESDTLAMSATVNGKDVGAASAGDPLRLVPGQPVEIVLHLTDHGTGPVDVRRVRLSGSVVGLTFFNYATTVQLTVPPGATDTLRYRLDLFGLQGQATGLIAGELALADASGATVASIPTVTDVRGSLFSVYGLFGLALVVLTALALIDVAFALAKHRLSENRWQRGLRPLAPGVGIGLVVAFTASVARLWVPNTGLWLVLAGLTAAVFFALGYFSPTPDHEEDEDLDEDDFDAPPEADTVATDGFGR